MSGLMDKAENAAQGELDQKAQPGDSVEKGADNDANQGINDAANDAGVPQGADQEIDKAADSKINEDIPFGNK